MREIGPWPVLSAGLLRGGHRLHHDANAGSRIRRPGRRVKAAQNRLTEGPEGRKVLLCLTDVCKWIKDTRGRTFDGVDAYVGTRT